jgi:ubiquitin-protein ligase E3 A
MANTLAMARCAFQTPPRFFDLTIVDDFPTHSFDIETLTVSGLKAAIETNDSEHVATYISRCCTPRAIATMFADIPLDHRYAISGLTELSQLAHQLSHVNGHSLGKLIAQALPDAIRTLSRSAPLYFGRCESSEWWIGRLYSLVLVLIPAVDLAEQRTIIQTLANVSGADAAVGPWFGRFPPEVIRGVLSELQSAFAILLYLPTTTHQLIALATVITAMYKANTAVNTRGVVSYKEFYNATAVDWETDDIVKDFERALINQTRSPESQAFCFTRFPCLVDTKFKSMLMQFEAIVQTRQHLRAHGGIHALIADPFLTLVVRRDRLVQSTLAEMQRKAQSLKKPLRVQFFGEEGIDAGGVRKEFFQLLMKQLLDPDFGMFYQTESRDLWFQPRAKCQVGGDEFQLIGTIIGLAVYNNVILDVSFPQALYRKLLGHKLDMVDLEEVEPALASGLSELLKFIEEDGVTVEEVFDRDFVYEYEVFDEHVAEELCDNGKNRKLTVANRDEFVDLTRDLILHQSIEMQFRRFNEGFRSVADRELMQTLHPEELELLVCGQPSFDFNELESSTRYEGYEDSDPTIQFFWKVLHTFDLEDKKLFLKFTTGSDRVPIGGLKDLNFIVGKNGDNEDMLPTAHTCFNHLLLPAYRDEETCARKLKQAIQNCHGFGLQ